MDLLGPRGVGAGGIAGFVGREVGCEVYDGLHCQVQTNVTEDGLLWAAWGDL